MNDFLKSAFSSLPAVAASPLAFVAYCLLLVVWLLIAIQVKRHRDLLSHLHKLPPKDRLKALQDELGGVKIKSGLTPEQWIRSRTRHHLFWGFLALLLAVVIVFTVAVTSRSEPGSADADITLVPEELETPAAGALSVKADPSADDVKLTYVYDRKGDQVQVRPRMRYLDLLARGGPVSGLKEDFQWTFPEVAVNIVNNTERTLLITEVQVTVHASTINKEPVLVFADESQDSLEITNVGWGEVREPRIDFGFTSAVNCLRLIPGKMRLRGSIALKSFSGGASVPIKVTEPKFAFDQQGRQLFQINLASETCVYGRIQYSTESAAEKSLWFKTRVYQGLTRMQGIIRMPNSVNALFLEAGKEGYTKRLPLSQYLVPGEADQFVIVVGTNKSAHFDLSLDFRTAGGVMLKGKFLDIDLFVPSSDHTDVVDLGAANLPAVPVQLKRPPDPSPGIQHFLKQMQEAEQRRRVMEAEQLRERLRAIAIEEEQRQRDLELIRQLRSSKSLLPNSPVQGVPPPE